jgi:chromosome segregation protein
MQKMQDRKAKLEEGLLGSQEPVDDHKIELEAKLESRLRVEDELSKVRTKVEAIESALRETEKNRNEIDQILQGLRSSLEGERMEAKTLDVQSQNLREQLQEEKFDLDEVLNSLNADSNEADFNEELESLANKISRLGAINLAAIDEYKTESERKTYLDEQNADLREALETLENAIKKIDRETRTRFKETFDKINSGIQELFPKVFGGGHAYLELTGEDLLDTGIAIMARPPGKRNSTIHLLSGGEKALTAIALVFSIFRLNPAPFCMLDEVDAPLDDANVGRYARMVEEMSQHVQFIYITHNKIAMEMAHQLMGVTMHEPGVSRIVTVDVDEAAELAAL